ncbi:response regulator [Phenylobacterium sp.]|uniref:response regulator n=1 Tax=Phenylobacterium sp. TaxID=1871053 RepID=UPI0035633E97
MKTPAPRADDIYVEAISPATTPEPRGWGYLAGQRVLVIDDDADLLNLMREAFEEEGAIVSTAVDGLQGLRAFAAEPTDLIVTDIIMPTREGIETIIELKRLSPSVKILAISGGGRINGDDFLELAKSFGAEATLGKPFRLNDLIALAHAILSSPPSAPA